MPAYAGTTDLHDEFARDGHSYVTSHGQLLTYMVQSPQHHSGAGIFNTMVSRKSAEPLRSHARAVVLELRMSVHDCTLQANGRRPIGTGMMPLHWPTSSEWCEYV